MSTPEAMSGLELLLASGDSVDKVHQAAWFGLLRETRLLATLGLEIPADATVEWEPDRGLFDLAVRGGGANVWIELKVDSGLGEHQRRRQQKRAAAGQLVYAFLGLSEPRSWPSPIRELESEGARVIRRSELARALDEVGVDTHGSAAGRQLAQAYARLLRGLGERGADFRRVEDKDWRSPHSVYLFQRLRRECPSMKDASIAYVSNASGGFEACYWRWKPLGEGLGVYLQWESAKLCFKILVEARGSRSKYRARAVAFLDEHKGGGLKIERPKRLGSGRTMTVGFVLLPIREETSWPAVVAGVERAIEINDALARVLVEPSAGTM